MKMDLQDKRNEYLRDRLMEVNLPAEPFTLFNQWISLAMEYNIYDANAMVLSTSLNNKPSSRVVLLKVLDSKGFVFFTNYHSRKGNELEKNTNAALNFYWRELEKQIRIEGVVERTSPAESDDYFLKRPLESRITAVVSNQSQEIESRETLEVERQKLLHSAEVLVRPEQWGGYRLIPEIIEFWQGRENRLHDRIEYFMSNGKWAYRRLAP
jgi:pyridoxamine 5'-phosphate oxidase